jgi:carbon monoxide dehydrogenase subunit G
VRFENAFAVRAPIEQVWSTLLDVERVATCMPGAEVLQKVDEDSYRIAIKVRIGPIAMTYRGDVQITERDEAARTAVMHAKAREARGQGTADAHVHLSLAEEQGGTRATLATDVALSGRVAAMGQGVIADVAARLVEPFAENLAAMLAADEGPPGTPVAAAASPADRAQPVAGAELAPAPTTPQRDTSSQSALPVGKIAAGVIAGRLANPRTLAIVAVIYAVACAAIGFLIGRVA